MQKPRIITRVALVAGIILAAVLALAFFLSIFADSEIVKAKFRAFVEEKTNGSAHIDKIELLWFPRPGAEISDVAISFGNEIQGTIERLRIHPSFRDLLTGSLAFSRVTAVGSAWRVRLPARGDEPFDLDKSEELIRAAVQGLALNLSGVNLRLRGGAADIGIGDGRSLVMTGVEGILGVAADKLDFSITAGSNLAEKIQLAGEIRTHDLAAEARLSLEKLGLRESFTFVSPEASEWVEDGAATLSLKIRAAGLKSFSAENSGSLPSLTLARGTRKLSLKGTDFNAVVSGDEKAFRLVVESLSLVSPPLNVTGELLFDRESRLLSVNLLGRDLDIGLVRESAFQLADDVTGVQRVFRYLHGGSVSEIRVEGRGRSFAEALKDDKASVSATFGGAKVFVPGPDLDLDNVGGSLSISAGVLRCTACSGTLGKVRGREGTLRVGLAGSGGPFHLDVRVETDAPSLQALLARHVKSEPFQKVLSRIRHAEGALSGRLVLGETLDSIAAKFLVEQAALKISYEPVPYPISLGRGRLDYEKDRIEFEGLEGAVGRSSFSRLTGSLRTDGTGQLQIKSAGLRLDLQQTEILLRKLEMVQARLGPDGSARGTIHFDAISLAGPIDDARRWDWTVKGKVDDIAVRHARLPGSVAVAGGTFSATREKLTFADAKVEVLDASMAGTGVIEDWQQSPFRMAATVSGIVGGRMIEWAQRQTVIPSKFTPRSPLEVSTGRIAWRNDGDYSFNGRLTVAHGPQFSVDMQRHLGKFTIKELSIEDGLQTARATLELDRDKWDLTFNGALNQRMLDRIFLAPPMRIGLLQGDFGARAASQPPYRLFASGTLAARGLVLPLKGEHAAIDQLIVQGETSGLMIRSAEVRWRRSAAALTGKLTAAQHALRVDMDILAGRLVWEEFSEAMSTAADRGESGHTGLPVPSLEGVVRLKAERFSMGTLTLSPFQVAANLAPNEVSGAFRNSVVCGIRTDGRFSIRNNDRMDLEVALSAKDGDLEATSRCISSEKSDISGTYFLDARMTGSGTREVIASTLSGKFEFVARDGKFIRAGGVDATFDYLNNTGDFDVAFPDLNRDAYPYRIISAKGTVERRNIVADELIIEAPPYVVTMQGFADLERKTVDAKGLVNVLLPADKVIKRIPLVGSLVSGSMVGIPIEITGNFDQPRVSYLSPAALGAEMFSIPARILKVPLEALQIFTPSAPEAETK